MNTGSVLAQFNITLSVAVSEPVQVDWFTSDGTAKAGVDYAANKGTVVFAPGETTKGVDILVYGRAVGSQDRSFFVEMLPPTNAILGASIGECIITVDTTGSTPVTAVIVPTGPVGPRGKSSYQSYLDTTTDNPPLSEADWVESLKGDPAEIAQEVASLIDVGATTLTAQGTETLSKPDSTTVKAVARRVAYASPARIANATLADGDNTLAQSDMTGDVLDLSNPNTFPRIMRGTSVISPLWSVQPDGKIIIKNAVAGDVLYVCQYDFTSNKNQSSSVRELWRREMAVAGLTLVDGSFEDGATITKANDAVWHMASGQCYVWQGALSKTVPEKSTPFSTGGVVPGAWVSSKQINNVTWTTPAAWPTLKAFFESPFGICFVPAGTYTITDTITANITNNKRIICEPGAIFKLADNVRKNMMVFIGNSTNTFEWCGGEIDGNWEGQGPETMTNGYINDVSHGLIVSKHKDAYIHDFYIHDCMGHHINHGGNTNFTAERIRIRAHPSALKPLGGARGDGITGCSANVVIRDISGFSTDDLIAVVSGIEWIAGWYPNHMNVESILIENIRCEVYNFEGTDRYCHTAVSIGNARGYSTNGAVVIRNIKGNVLSRGIGYTAESYGPDYYGQFNGDLSISDVDLFVRGDPANGFTARKNTAHIVIGCEGFNTASSSRNNYCKTVSITNVVCRGTPYSGTGIILGHMNTRAVYINDLKCVYENADDNMVALMIVGQKDIGPVTIENVYQQIVGASTDATRNAKKIIESYYGGSGAMTINGRNLMKQPNVAGTSVLPNCTALAATGFTKVNPRLFGKDLVWDLDSAYTGGVAALPLVDGINFSTPGLGHISYSKISDAWTFHEFSVQWDTTNYGMPSAANFPNFAQFSWKAGTVVPVKGSPLGEATAYTVLGGTPTFNLRGGTTFSVSAVLQSSGWTPLINPLTPGSTIITEIPEGSTDAGFPQTGAGILETHVSTYINRVQTRQIWQRSGTRFDRYWTGTNWSDFTAF